MGMAGVGEQWHFSSLAGYTVFSRKKEPRTCPLHTECGKGCTAGRRGFMCMETLGKSPSGACVQTSFHAPSCNNVLLQCSRKHPGTAVQIPPCQWCLPLPPQTSLAQSYAGLEREKLAHQALLPQTYALCPWLYNFSVKTRVSSAEGTEGMKLAHHTVVANISRLKGTKTTVYFGISS